MFFHKLNSYSQTDTIIGKAYRNVVDYKNNIPIFESKCVFKEYKNSKYKDSYKLKIIDKKFNKLRKMNIRIISDGKDIYFNARHHAIDAGFIKF